MDSCYPPRGMRAVDASPFAQLAKRQRCVFCGAPSSRPVASYRCRFSPPIRVAVREPPRFETTMAKSPSLIGPRPLQSKLASKLVPSGKLQHCIMELAADIRLFFPLPHRHATQNKKVLRTRTRIVLTYAYRSDVTACFSTYPSDRWLLHFPGCKQNKCVSSI
mgnify:FL=1